MLYDETYSFDVSLSEILDEFLHDDTPPDIILNFLSNYYDEIDQIFKNSICYKQIFQVDFYLRCNRTVRNELFKLMEHVKPQEYSYLCWQLKSRYFSAELTTDEKSIINRFLLQVTKEDIRHPYSHRHELYIRDFEENCSKCIHDTKSMTLIGKYYEVNPDEYEAKDLEAKKFDIFGTEQKWYVAMQQMMHSLFKWRTLQYDVFANLNPKQKYIYITMLPNMDVSDLEEIQLQLYDSDEDVEIKKVLYSKVTTEWKRYTSWSHDPLHSIFKNDPEILKIVNNAHSFEEIQLNVSLLGILPPYKKIALWCLMAQKKSFLKDWAKYDKETFDSALNIRELLPYI